MSNRRAPEGCVYVCGACGKVSNWQYGFEDNGTPQGGPHDASPGWDESCAMHSELVPVTSIVDPVGWVYPQRVKKANWS